MGLHRLAAELGMTVERLCDEMSMKEFYDWVEYFTRISTPGEIPTAESKPPLELAQASAAQLKELFG
jgi:hypothetical protein